MDCQNPWERRCLDFTIFTTMPPFADPNEQRVFDLCLARSLLLNSEPDLEQASEN